MIIGDGIMLGAGGEAASIFATGLSENDTVTASKDGKSINGKLVCRQNPDYIQLPNGYTQETYIQSNGNQYLKIPTPTVSNGFTIEFSFCSGEQPSGYYPLFVSIINNGLWIGWYNGAFVVRKCNVGNVFTCNFTKNTWINAKLVYSGTTVTLFFDDVQVGSGTASFSDGASTTYLLYDGANKSSCKLGKFKFSVGTTTVYHYIPCKNSSNNIGLYDLVNNAFYSNAGTGAFTAGEDVNPYIIGFEITPIKSYGTWTVANSDSTKSADVLIDAAAEFEVTL